MGEDGLTAMASLWLQTEISTKVNGIRIELMVRASTRTRTDLPTTVNGLRMRKAERVSNAGQMVPSMKESSCMAASTVKVCTSRPLVLLFLRDSSITTRWMGMANTTSLMAACTKD